MTTLLMLNILNLMIQWYGEYDMIHNLVDFFSKVSNMVVHGHSIQHFHQMILDHATFESYVRKCYLHQLKAQ